MKKILNILCIAALSFTTWGCDDFFDTDPDDIINTGDYISEQSEMYSGYYGILNKIQGMADHAIYLTDTRADNLEATITAPQELRDIYNYAPTNGNSYADPSCYYSLIIVCNDYLNKMAEFKQERGQTFDETAETNWKGLISSAIRVKAWTYLRLAQVYGNAYWFSDPMLEMKDLGNTSIFTHYTTAQDVVAKALELLDNGETTIKGLEGVNGSLTMNWASYMNPEDPNASTVKYWDYVTPDWLLLRCELLLWSGNPDYDWIRNQILNKLQTVFNGSSTQFRLNANLTANYYKIFDNTYYSDETVCSAMYSYLRNQTNKTTSHFSLTAPNNYYLRSSSYGNSRYTASGDSRLKIIRIVSDDTLMAKYIYSSARRTYQSDAPIPLQRAHDYHFYLSEAENALGNWKQAACILNGGVASYFNSASAIENDSTWDNRYSPWARYGTNFNLGITGSIGATQHSYGCVLENGRIPLCVKAAGIGDDVVQLIVGSPTESIALAAEKAIKDLERDNIPHSISKDGKIYLPNEAARQKYFDLQLLDEMLLEYIAEGRTYGMMIRMAQKYNDPSIIANRVCPKYPASLQDQVRARILSGHYFVDWNL